MLYCKQTAVAQARELATEGATQPWRSSICMYVCIYIYTHMYIYIYRERDTCMYIYIYMYTHVYVYMYV